MWLRWNGITVFNRRRVLIVVIKAKKKDVRFTQPLRKMQSWHEIGFLKSRSFGAQTTQGGLMLVHAPALFRITKTYKTFALHLVCTRNTQLTNQVTCFLGFFFYSSWQTSSAGAARLCVPAEDLITLLYMWGWTRHVSVTSCGCCHCFTALQLCTSSSSALMIW